MLAEMATLPTAFKYVKPYMKYSFWCFFLICSKAGGGRDIFASVGADGSVRMFDLRHLEHSTIIYEDPGHTPLLRLAWNKQDPNYLATVSEKFNHICI